jgi:SAM-dependent methyltransferase
MIDACPWCDGPPACEFEAVEMMFGLRHGFTYARCNSCGSLWLREVPDLNQYYGPQYYSMTADARGSDPSVLASAWARLILRLPSAAKSRLAGRRGFPRYLLWFAGRTITLNMRIADIGSGEGGMVSRLVRHGFCDVWGFDPFITSDRDEGHAHYRKRGITRHDGPFDIIMFNHSLEHAPQPKDALRAAVGALVDNGVIIVRIPVALSWADRHYGPDWVSLDPPRHLAIPSVAGMSHTVGATSLRIARTFYDSFYLQFSGSENYRHRIPLKDQLEPTRGERRMLQARSRRLNRTGDGDNAGFVLVKDAGEARLQAPSFW